MMDRDGSEKRKRAPKDHRVPSSASCSSASSTNSPPEKKCGPDDSLPMHQQPVEDPTHVQVKLEFCQAVGRPDTKIVKRMDSRSIPNKILVRETATATHVLLMGTTSFILNPLFCPYGESLDECKSFRAAAPEFMKSHLEGKHNMSNVLINLVCPCPPKHHNKKSCSVVKFDAYDNVLCGHVIKFHKAYYESVQLALYDQKMGDLDLLKRVKFPSWTATERLLPSQVIPDKIVFPTIVNNNEVCSICNIDACHGRLIRQPFYLSAHMFLQHKDRFNSQTRLYFACPAQACPVQEPVDSNIISHVAAMHPELIGRQLSADVQEKCARYEKLIVGRRIGAAVTNTVQTYDGTPGTAAQYLEVYRCPVENCSQDSLRKRDHLIWHIRDQHARHWSLA